MLRIGRIAGITGINPVIVYQGHKETKMPAGRIRNIMVVIGLCCLTALSALAQKNKKYKVLACYPGGAVRARDAKPAMDSMVSVLESIGNWEKGSISVTFTSKAKKCRELLAKKKPEFAILSLGLYLEHRHKHNLAPLVVPKMKGMTTDKYRLLVKKGSYKNLAELKGKTIGGNHLSEPEFLKRIVFLDKLDPLTEFKLKPSSRSLRSLRKLSQGKLDAVIVNDQEYSSIGLLSFGDQLEVIFTSETLPQMGVVADTKKTSPAERDRLVKSLTGMCSHQEGDQLCKVFGIQSFESVDQSVYQKVVQLWEDKKTK
jgi:ABC-type phosphate/phosphonate transport system substrate-binding protein